jgi:hypothetical protein
MLHIDPAAANPAAVILATGAILAALAGIGRWLVLPGLRLARATWRFLEDWNGHPGHHGEPAVSGVVDRIVAIEYQLHPNGGGSVKDAVDRIEAKVDRQTASAAEVKAALEVEQAKVRSELEAHRTSTTEQFNQVWQTIATRDIHKAADALEKAADKVARPPQEDQ